MARMVLGVFDERSDAERSIFELEDAGYNPRDISIIMKDTIKSESLSENTGASVAKGAASGIATGGVIGALAGLLTGIGAIVIPGLGAVLIGGPLAAALGLTGAAALTLSGAATGALAGGLIGALVGLGVPEEEARVYETRVREGGILIAVPTLEEASMDAADILSNNGAEQVRTISMSETGKGKYRDDGSRAYFHEVRKRG